MGSITYPNLYRHHTINRATNGGTVFSGNLATTPDMDYFTDTAVVNDAIYFSPASDAYVGCQIGVRVNVGTVLAAGSITVVWEYYSRDVFAWVQVSNLSDPSNIFRNAGQHDIIWDFPVYGMYRYINGASRCYVRCRITAIAGIVEGGANQTTAPEQIRPTIVIEGNNGGAAWMMTDVLAADVAGGWNRVKELEVGFPTDVHFQDLPVGSETRDPWPDRSRRWLVNACITFDDVTEPCLFEAKKETIICHSMEMESLANGSSNIQFGEYDAASGTTRRGCTIIYIGNYCTNPIGYIARQCKMRRCKFYASTLECRGSADVPLQVWYTVGFEAVDAVFLNVSLAYVGSSSASFKRVKWIIDRENGPWMAASATFEDCIFFASEGMSSAMIFYINQYPITVDGGKILRHALATSAVRMFNFGTSHSDAEAKLIDVEWSEDGNDLYWYGIGSGCHGYLTSQKSLTLKVVDEAGNNVIGADMEIYDVDGVLVASGTTDGSGNIPKKYLTIAEYRANDPVAQNGLGSDVTMKTPHRMTIIKSGYRTVNYKFTVTGKMEWTIGLPLTGSGPGGPTVTFVETPTVRAKGAVTVRCDD